VLMVDDEVDNLEAFRFAFRKQFRLHYAEGGQEALKRLEELDAAVVVADQRMPRMSGVELLGEVKRRQPSTYGILLTAYADVDVLVDAVNSGAVDRYVPKPWNQKELTAIVRQGIDAFATKRENRRLREQLQQYTGYLEAERHDALDYGLLQGVSPAARATMAQVEEVAQATAPVLVQGEAGTEVDVIARAVAALSPRDGQPFVEVNVAAHPDAALEREVFGHVKGAFDGALNRRPGRVELAARGTLYLHGLRGMSKSFQGRLLRVLRDGETERVGEMAARSVDVRLVVSCSPDLGTANPELLPELEARLAVFPIAVAPLRDRPEDLPLMAEHLLRKYGAATQPIAPEAVAKLAAYSWPGNVRELSTVIERASILARGSSIAADHLRFSLPDPRAPQTVAARPLSRRLDDLERQELIAALEKHKGNKAEVARALGINRTTLYYRIKKLGIDA
ncbi:MAG: sigma-54 dependent transcriptional regulator, partial [Myxococcota bacterium]